MLIVFSPQAIQPIHAASKHFWVILRLPQFHRNLCPERFLSAVSQHQPVLAEPNKLSDV